MKRLLTIFLFSFFFATGVAQNEFSTIIIADFDTESPTDTYNIDFDKDGDIDIIGSIGGSDSFLWFENDGNGNFTSHIIDNSENFSDGAYQVSAADIDNDGDLDVIGTTRSTSSPYLARLILFENDGNFNFTPSILDSFTASSLATISSINVVDLNEDGFIDILTANNNTDSFDYYLNNSQGQFTRIVINNSEDYAKDASDVGYIDMDNDGDLDVIGTLKRPAKYLWFENDGNENFIPHVIEDTYLLIDGAISVDAGDVDNDGDIDLVGASSDARRFLWFENDGAQNFTTKEVEYDDQYAYNANKVKLTDIDNDGDLDVLGSSNHSFSTGLYWFENDATDYPQNRFRSLGDNSSVKVISQGGGVSSAPNRNIDVADFDNDGDLDMTAFSNSNFFWFDNDGTSLDFSKKPIGTSFVADGAKQIYSADLDGDNDLDFVSLSSLNNISWHENLGNNSFKTHITVEATSVFGSAPSNIELKDFDNDGDFDIIGASILKYPDNSYNEAYFWFENDGIGNFQFNFINNPSSPLQSASYFAVSDFDNDNDSDLIGLSTFGDDKINLFRNDGNNSFISELILDVSINYRSATKINSVDLDSDGYTDILVQVHYSNDNDLLWLRNDGLGNFEIKEIVLPARTYDIVTIVSKDMDNDGDVDLIASGKLSPEKLGWYENDGDENFIFHLIDADINIISFDVLDIDNDFDSDIALVEYQSGFQFLRNEGGGVFTISEIDNTSINSGGATFVNHVDFNGDGAPDIIGASGADSPAKYGDAFLIYVNEGVKNEIQGKISLDTDSNGCDSQDLLLKNVMVTTGNGIETKTTFTDENGLYRLLVGTGNYTTSPSSNLPAYFSPTPNAPMSTFDSLGNIENIDFCFDANQPANDLSIIIVPTSEVRPGFGAKYELVYKNNGTTDLSGSISFEYDNRLSFYYSSETFSSHSSNLLSFDFNNIKPFESRKINLAFTVPLLNNINLGDILKFTATIDPVTGDYTETNNIFDLEQTVIGSYDPNDITVVEGEEVHINDITDYLNYVIRFQNTGTASAINVRVDHELDTDLDWETFTPISSSHTNTTTITNGKDVEFLFENINLPDSTANEAASHGHIAFKIKPKSDVSVGDKVVGTASIYFDFNPPIITNMVSTEFVDENELLVSTALVDSPVSCPEANDAVVQVEATGGNEPYFYELLDENSTVLITTQSSNIFVNLAPGSYITRVIDNNGEESFFNITIQEPLPVDTTFIVTDITCFGADNGQIEVNATGGLAPYSYRIDGGVYQASNLFENLLPGQYNVETIDVNGCGANELIEIIEPEFLTATTVVSEVSCKGLSDGSVSVTAMGGTSPYEYSLDGATFSTGNAFSDLSSGQYTAWVQDTNGCITTIQATLAEPNDPDFDNDGLGNACDDDIDGDGVTNVEDLCPETLLGTQVGNSGCSEFTLANTNFTVQITGETCASRNNGNIIITAIENLDYIATLTNEGNTIASKNFRTFASFHDLAADNYDICIKVEGQTGFERCFSVEIIEPEPLDVDAKINTSGKSVTLKMKGGENYTININGETYTTSLNEIELPISSKENQLLVKTDKDCQGVFEETFIVNVSNILVYPNPVANGEVSVVVPKTSSEAVILTIYSNNGRLVSRKVIEASNNPISLNVSGMTAGVYNLKIETKSQTHFQRIIIK